MAAWCLNTGQSVNTYRSLTRAERDAFTRVIKQRRPRG